MSIQLRICGVSELHRHVGVTHVISIWDSSRATDPDLQREMARLFKGAKIHFGFFDDIEEPIPGYVPPAAHEVREMLEFAASCKEGDSLLVHCHAGVSRSTAIAFAAVCHLEGPGRESVALSMIRNIRSGMNPNLLIVHHADSLLGRGGSMKREVIHYRSRIVPYHVATPEDLMRLATRRATAA
jgi:predicted protein tyrosine phosphatase